MKVTAVDVSPRMLGHVRKRATILGFLFDVLNPIVVRIMGADINRRTTENIRRAGWRIQIEERLSLDVVRWIEAQP